MDSVIAALKAQELSGGNAFAAFNHLELEHVEPDYAVFRLHIQPESKNPYGYVHGGMLAGMADNAAGYAAHSDGRAYVTLSSHLNYMHNQAGGVIRAEGRVLHRGKTTCVVRVDIRGENGTLLATGELIYFCVDPQTYGPGK
ncbi:MAG: PaaI family thioesterase [Ruminococcaceae bacterium]|jgi:acyl-CoA thioesterase|nr:PaaI family thioesterase [Oscillospiraceae bacterium]